MLQFALDGAFPSQQTNAFRHAQQPETPFASRPHIEAAAEITNLQLKIAFDLVDPDSYDVGPAMLPSIAERLLDHSINGRLYGVRQATDQNLGDLIMIPSMTAIPPN